MLNYTGHPLVDVGIATITAFAEGDDPEKDDPTKLTETELEKIADFMSEQYVRDPLKSFLTVAFTSNAWFIQDAYNPDNKPNLSTEKREQLRQERDKWANHHLRQWTKKAADQYAERDIFTGEAAVPVKLSNKLLPGRAGRAQIPLLSGDESINFYPNGSPGLPISGKSLLCLQAFPLGCAKRSGRLLAVHSDNPEITLEFARKFLEENLQAIQMARIEGASKLQEADYSYRTLFVDTLLHAKAMQRKAKRDRLPFSVTAYYLTNGKDPKLDIYYLPLQMTEFLKDMISPDYREEWFTIVNRSWEKPPKKKKEVKNFKPRRNWLYEDLMNLAKSNDATQFVQKRFLRPALRYVKKTYSDSQNGRSSNAESYLASWKIFDAPPV